MNSNDMEYIMMNERNNHKHPPEKRFLNRTKRMLIGWIETQQQLDCCTRFPIHNNNNNSNQIDTEKCFLIINIDAETSLVGNSKRHDGKILINAK